LGVGSLGKYRESWFYSSGLEKKLGKYSIHNIKYIKKVGKERSKKKL
jgi:hypothetical protein